ncbi:hypothetical protein MVEN_01097800 [Mycena venus]|uniref:Uncharacterized protein n=1 Tax=Mycena venus TaxID=2733690 RepID=A0A8H6Y7Z5_9AGAR|nr:hypothetical protein MVEN_01097800 [Mycena venus]
MGAYPRSTGPAVVGYFLNWGLLGTLTLQLYLYYQAFPKDRSFTKCLVFGVYAIVLVQTMLVTRDAVTTFVYRFDDPCALANRANLGFEWFSLPVMCPGGLHRAIFLRVPHPSFIEIVENAGFHRDCFPNQRYRGVFVWLFCTSMYVITPSRYLQFLTYNTYLDPEVNLDNNRDWISSAVTALASLILMFTFPGKAYFFTPAVVPPMLYANTLLAVLNSRFQILDGRGYTPTQDMSLPTFLLHGGGSSGLHRSVTSPIVTTEREAFGTQELDDLSKTKDIRQLADTLV